MQDSTFAPRGPTYYFDSTGPVQVLTTDNVSCTSVRIVNLTATTARFTWVAGKLGQTAPTITVTTPTAGVPSTNTIAMAGGSVETLMIPPNSWFQAATSATFEVTPGEGL